MRLLGACAVTLLGLSACGMPPARETARDLRVLVYNIHAGKDAGGADNLERVAAIIRETAADLVLLQEVDSMTTRSGGVDQLSVLGTRLGMHRAYGRTIPWQGGGFGNGILSRFPIAAHALIPLPHESAGTAPGGRVREARGALVATLRAPGGLLHVINTHLDASRDDGWRRREAMRVVQITDSLRRTGVPVILGGDLNSTPESSVQGILRQGALRDVWPTCGRGPELTFPAATPDKRIDYLYLTGEASCTEARVVGSLASDHRPLLVLARVPSR